MTTTAYIHDGSTLTAALTAQGTVVPLLTKRIIKSAALVNTTGAPVACSVVITDAAAVDHPKINARPIAAGETYLCPELVGKGISSGGVPRALGLGVSFDYTATDIV